MTIAVSRQREDLPKGYFRYARKPYMLTNEAFRFWLVRGKRLVRIDDLVESCAWEDVDVNLRGTIALRELPGIPPLQFALGDQVRLAVAMGGSTSFTPLWDMVIDSESRTLSTDARSFTLTDGILSLDRSQDTWKFVRGKGHPKGWLTGDVIREVGKRYGFPVHISKTEARVTKYIKQKASPMSVIQEMLTKERTQKNRRMVVRFKGGALYVTPLNRSKVLMHLGHTIMDGRVALTKDEKFATQLTLRATTSGKGKRKPRKIHLTLDSKEGIRRFGRIHREEFVANADSLADLRRIGKTMLKDALMPVREFSFTHNGIPNLRRGLAIKLFLKEFGLTQVVWVKSISHSLTPGGYTIDVTVVFDDPFEAEDKAAAKKKREAAARRRRRPTEDPGQEEEPTRVTPTAARQRRDA